MKLTEKERKEQERKQWFRKAAYEGKPILNKHHIQPKHHGGENSELVQVTVMEHANLHLDIYKDTGCKTCYKSYLTLKGQHDEWVRIQKLCNDNVHYDILDYDKDTRDKKHINKHPYKQMALREPMDFSNFVNDVLDEEAEENIYSDTDKETLKDEVNQSLDTLKGRERKVIKMFFGIDRDCALTLNQIGEKFNLTRLRVRQIKEKAIRRLQHRSRANSLRVYA